MPKVPKVEESAFSANHFLLKLVVPRAHASTLAHSCPPMYCGGLVHFKL